MAIGSGMVKRCGLAIMVAILGATMSGQPLETYAVGSPEQRCNDLGAVCLCSEPLQATSYAQNTNWYNPNDSTFKECQSDIGGGYGIVHSTTDDPPLVGNDAAVLAALPAGHQVTRYMRYPEGYNGGKELNHISGALANRARVAVRWYIYYSPNITFKDDGGCTNAMKYFIPYPSGGQWDTASGHNSAWIFYGIASTINGTFPSSGYWDCCTIPPGAQSGTPMSIVPGHWYRVEVILRKWSGSAETTIFEGYRKDITTNGPEYKFIDSTVACTNCGTIGFQGQNWPGNSGMRMTGDLNKVEINMFRAGTCQGYKALSHALVAAWDTDAGQRVGAAIEVEGGGGSQTPSNPGSVTLQ